MSVENVSNKYCQDISELSGIRGIGTLVLNENHEILVGKEFLAKREHQRQSGQTSIPLETLKRDEVRNINAIRLAGLSEITTAENIELLRQFLREAAFNGPILMGESGILGALSVLHWKGDPTEMPFRPSVPGEFGNFRWMKPRVALELTDLRPYADVMIRYADDKGLLNGLSSRPIPLLGKLDIDRYTAIRQDKIDIGQS